MSDVNYFLPPAARGTRILEPHVVTIHKTETGQLEPRGVESPFLNSVGLTDGSDIYLLGKPIIFRFED
jgi:hypothetical protein